MKILSKEDAVGIDFDWIACDGNGHIAAFATGGGSFTPEPFLIDTDAHRTAMDAILSRPPTTGCLFVPELPPGWPNEWRLLTERGLFAFDGTYSGAPYKIVAAPEEPVHIDALPEAAQVVLRALTYPDLSFRDLQVIPADLLERYRR